MWRSCVLSLKSSIQPKICYKYSLLFFNFHMPLVRFFVIIWLRRLGNLHTSVLKVQPRLLQTTVHDATMLLTHLLQKPWVTARCMTQHSLDKKGKEFVLSGLQMGTKTSNVHLSLCLATDHMCFAGIIVELCMCWGSVSMETEHNSVRQRKLDGLHARLLEAPDFNYL